MQCTKCGNKIEGDAKLCGKCGNPVGQVSGDVSNNDSSADVSTSKSVVVSVFSILALILVFVGVRYLTQEGTSSFSQNDSPSKQEMIERAVTEIEENTAFPVQLDELTVWTSITSTPNSIRYQYTLQNIDESQVSDTMLKNLVAPTLCKNTNTRYVLDKDINMEYSYAVKDSAQTYFFAVSKQDCL